MELKYTHDALDLEIVAPGLNLARQAVFALVSSAVLFSVGFCGSFALGAVLAGMLEAGAGYTDIPLTLELVIGFTAVGAALATGNLGVWGLLLWRRWRASAYHLSIDARQIRVQHAGQVHSWPLAGCRALQDGSDLLLIPMEERAFRIPLAGCSEVERNLIAEALRVTQPQIEEPGAPPPEIEALRRKIVEPES